MKKHKIEELQDMVEQEHKNSKDMRKVTSELAHYKQLYLEQMHTINRLTKQVKNFKEDNCKLKRKLFKQENDVNRFIFEMTQRFDNSRK